VFSVSAEGPLFINRKQPANEIRLLLQMLARGTYTHAHTDDIPNPRFPIHVGTKRVKSLKCQDRFVTTGADPVVPSI
jgi:hypothetical protein